MDPEIRHLYIGVLKKFSKQYSVLCRKSTSKRRKFVDAYVDGTGKSSRSMDIEFTANTPIDATNSEGNTNIIAHQEYLRSKDSVLRDILWEEDGLNLDLKTCYYSNALKAHSTVNNKGTESGSDEGKSSRGTSSISDSVEDRTEDEETANEPVEAPVEVSVENTKCAENYKGFTYWSIDTKSTINRKGYKMSLLEESEAFVTNAFWVSKDFSNTPRHLLLQVAQIASRAFFDPHYRLYLQNTYL
ncbi:conserved hypothetical protein [Theileria equi strain WA]|uniref:Uncharacterized protein n=1 Tax=Theileria equi strain WA TaxID=1537102 RepID=L1LFY0_THEEQ|nr:conserved hypothetical protein [Theileria equi strain WA]EKX74170.1 conserved hypothetical protein [Theileria equi strain WA]|eukprot:XP_004833622.1 conserved hypothetical protein [Theileria equi strain WA]